MLFSGATCSSACPQVFRTATRFNYINSVANALHSYAYTCRYHNTTTRQPGEEEDSSQLAIGGSEVN